MRIIKHIWLGLFAAAAGTVSMSSCHDTKEQSAAPFVEINAESVRVSKLGVDYKGETPSVTVASNVYWKIEMTVKPAFTEGEEPWVSVPLRGGSGINDVEAVFEPNSTDEERTVTMRFVALGLPEKTVVFRQSPNTADAIFYTDDFGSENAAGIPVDDFTGWNFSGIGVDMPTAPPFYYTGSDALVDSSNPSSGEQASGGNNILLDGGGAQFILNNIRPADQLDLQLGFMACKEDGDFIADDFVVEISSDGRNWHKIAYSRPADGEWMHTVFDFTLAEKYKYIFFRFRSVSGEAYRIDDITLKDSSIGGPVMALTEVAVKTGVTFPVEFPLSAELMVIYGYQETFDRDRYIISTRDQFARLEYVMEPLSEFDPDYADRSEFTWLTGGTGQPYVSYQWKGDYWLFRLHVDLVQKGSLIEARFTARSTSQGLKYYRMQYFYDRQDDWFDMEQTKEVPEKEGDYYTHALSSGGHDVVTGYFRMPETIENGDILIRFYASSAVRPNGAVITNPASGTNRISGGTDGPNAVITMSPPETEPVPVEITLGNVLDNVIDIPGTNPGTVIFTVKANYFWTLSTTDLSWAEVSGWRGRTDEEVTVSIKAKDNPFATARRGKITITAGSTTRNIIVLQSPPSGEIPVVHSLPAQWNISAGNMPNYQTSFEEDNKLFAESESTAYISYVQRDDTSNDTDNKFSRQVGSTGHPFVTGAWPGDYWLFTCPVKDLVAGARINITFITRPSGTGHRFWALEYYEGDEWKPVPALRTITLEDSTVVEFTHDMQDRGSQSNLSVDETFTYGTAIPSGQILIRFRCAANWQDGGGALERPNGGTHRFAGAGTADSPFIQIVP